MYSSNNNTNQSQNYVDYSQVENSYQPRVPQQQPNHMTSSYHQRYSSDSSVDFAKFNPGLMSSNMQQSQQPFDATQNSFSTIATRSKPQDTSLTLSQNTSFYIPPPSQQQTPYSVAQIESSQQQQQQQQQQYPISQASFPQFDQSYQQQTTSNVPSISCFEDFSPIRPKSMSQYVPMSSSINNFQPILPQQMKFYQPQQQQQQQKQQPSQTYQQPFQYQFQPQINEKNTNPLNQSIMSSKSNYSNYGAQTTTGTATRTNTNYNNSFGGIPQSNQFNSPPQTATQTAAAATASNGSPSIPQFDLSKYSRLPAATVNFYQSRQLPSNPMQNYSLNKPVYALPQFQPYSGPSSQSMTESQQSVASSTPIKQTQENDCLAQQENSSRKRSKPQQKCRAMSFSSERDKKSGQLVLNMSFLSYKKGQQQQLDTEVTSDDEEEKKQAIRQSQTYVVPNYQPMNQLLSSKNQSRY